MFFFLRKYSVKDINGKEKQIENISLMLYLTFIYIPNGIQL